MIHVGIVGAGFMALTHLRALQKVPQARLGALCNPSGRNLDGDFTQVARGAGESAPVRIDLTGVKTSRDPESLFQDPDIHIVDLCTPTATHVDLATRALAAGKHVLLEKPIARTSADVEKIVAAAQAAARKGVFLMPALCIRFWPEYVWLRQTIRSGLYGRVLDARFRRVASAPGWGQSHFLKGKDSGGALLDLHIHDTDFIYQCFGLPDAVTSSGYSKVSGAIDHVVTLYHYANGPTVSAEGSWGMTPGYPFHMGFVVNFEQATVDFDISRGPEALRLFVAGVPVTSLKPEGGDGYVGEIRHLVDSVRQQTPPSVVTPEDALASTRICEAEESSIQKQETVRLRVQRP